MKYFKILIISFLVAITLNADEIKISGNSKIFNDFKKEALKYDTSIPAYDYAFSQELLPKTIRKMLEVDDEIGLELINKVSNLNELESLIGDFSVIKLAKEYKATKCMKKLKEIGYK